ncbi:MAG: retropepsin-like aspartic protease family protein [Planctomycetota bacterium]|jgi:aspartyl protease family protein
MKLNKYRVFKTAILVLLVYMAISSNVYASTKICYRGLRSGKALININGRLVELTPGQSFRNIVKLLSANEEVIVIEVSGKRYQYKKNSSQGTILAEEVILTRAPGASNYWAMGKINGKDVTFIVDTGATYVVLNKVQAGALKIKLGNKEVEVSTASKIETAYQVLLDTVSVGDIKVHNVPALITKHTYPQEPLLGMSFLQHVDISQENERMILKSSD